MKVAVYAGTRNIYSDMLPAAKSLLIHSDVDKIYFLIEDDEFPYELPPEIECIDVSNQTYFDPNGPNYKSKCTYMVLIRAALSKVFPQYDTILSLDVDTIVNENINDIWNYNLDGYYNEIKELLNKMVHEGFTNNDRIKDVYFVDNIEELEKYLKL